MLTFTRFFSPPKDTLLCVSVSSSFLVILLTGEIKGLFCTRPEIPDDFLTNFKFYFLNLSHLAIQDLSI